MVAAYVCTFRVYKINMYYYYYLHCIIILLWPHYSYWTRWTALIHWGRWSSSWPPIVQTLSTQLYWGRVDWTARSVCIYLLPSGMLYTKFVNGWPLAIFQLISLFSQSKSSLVQLYCMYICDGVIQYKVMFSINPYFMVCIIYESAMHQLNGKFYCLENVYVHIWMLYHIA